MERVLVIEERFGYISSRVPRIFKPKLIIKNFAKEAVEFLRSCKNPKGFFLPDSEPEVPQFEGYELNVFFRLYYTDIEDFGKSYTIEDLKVLKSPLVEFEMSFLAGRVPFADFSRVYIYKLKREEAT